MSKQLICRFLSVLSLTLCLSQDICAKAEEKKVYKDVLITEVPHVRQKPDFCGEACAEMYLRKLGKKNIDHDYVFDQSGLNPLKARGCFTPELTRALKIIGKYLPSREPALIGKADS